MQKSVRILFRPLSSLLPACGNRADGRLHRDVRNRLQQKEKTCGREEGKLETVSKKRASVLGRMFFLYVDKVRLRYFCNICDRKVQWEIGRTQKCVVNGRKLYENLWFYKI